MEDVPETTNSSFLDTQEPHRSRKIVKIPNQFMFLEEDVSDELDLDPSTYNESISDKDSRNWQSSMKAEMESVYSTHV